MDSKNIFYNIMTEDPDTKQSIHDLLREKIQHLKDEKKLNIDIYEGVFKKAKIHVRHNKAYFIHVDTKKIYEVKNGYAHSKAIAIDATRGGKRFGVQRSQIIGHLKDIGFDNISDFLENDRHHYCVEILRLAANNGWLRLNMMSKGHVELQGNDMKEIASALQVVNEGHYIKEAIVEDYTEPTPESYVLRNRKEVQFFIRYAKYKRIAIADFL